MKDRILVLLLSILLLCGCSHVDGKNGISPTPTITPGGTYYFVFVDGTIMYVQERLDAAEDYSDFTVGKVQYIGSAYGFPSENGQSNCENYRKEFGADLVLIRVNGRLQPIRILT